MSESNGTSNGECNGSIKVNQIQTQNELTPRQEEVAILMAGGIRVGEASQETGVPEQTIRCWLHREPAFKRRIRELRGELTEVALGALSDVMRLAVDKLKGLLNSKSEFMVHKTAESILTFGCQLAALSEIQSELEELKSSATLVRLR